VDNALPDAPDAIGAINPIFANIYDRLKILASRQRYLGGSPATLCTTELVHETYLKIGDSDFQLKEPNQFFAYAARAMRFILTDAARRRAQPKRGGDLARVSLADPVAGSVFVDPALALELDEALTSLERVNERAARVTELHYFAGLTMREVANVLGVVERTAERDWRYARAFIAARSR
jgi:RNA polymerase sigma factor (TIGR02999 family)